MTVVSGKGYVEVKLLGVNKGKAVERILQTLSTLHGDIDFVFCIGDDRLNSLAARAAALAAAHAAALAAALAAAHAAAYAAAGDGDAAASAAVYIYIYVYVYEESICLFVCIN